MSIVEFLKSNHIISASREIIFYGGSFNPWHKGHAECLNLCRKVNNNDPIVIIPDHNPHKKLIAIEQRSNPLEIITEHIQSSNNVFLFSSFYKDEKQNPTFKWIRDIKNYEKRQRVSLLIGFDSFEKIHTWNESHELINNLTTLYIASRNDDENIKTEQTHKLKSINPELKLQFLGNHSFENLSSTKLRASDKS
jgi:nicotinate-nucleotide adenylyltransferase